MRIISKIRYYVQVRILGKKPCYDVATDKPKLGVIRDAAPESPGVCGNQARAPRVQEIELNASATEGKSNLCVSLLSRFIVQPATSSPDYPLMRPTAWYGRRPALKIRLQHFRSLWPTLTPSCRDKPPTKIVPGSIKESDPCGKLSLAPRFP